MPQTIIDLLNRGIDANNADRFRKANLISLPSKTNLVVAGDIHGHVRNFERIVAFADLSNNPDRHVILQEIIHGGIKDSYGNCSSYKLLFKAVQHKVQFPDRVHFLLANHDTAFINNSKVMKEGREMNSSMRQAIEREFELASDSILLAIRQFLFSQPLAVRCENRIWLSHSLPADRFLELFEVGIFNRKLKINDIVRPGSAYLLTWGRRHSQRLLNKMADLLDVDNFILGHQAQKNGWSIPHENLIIIASDHNHGCILHIDLSKSYTIEQLTEAVIPLASIL